jgi:curved DNA-binding protein CbpA
MAQGRAALSPSRGEYAVLGLAPGATRTDVKRAFRALAHTTHPDHGGDAAEFRAVKHAYEALRDAVPADARAAHVHGAYATTVDLDLVDFPAAPARPTPPARRPAPAPAPAAARPARTGAFASLLQDALGRLATA